MISSLFLFSFFFVVQCPPPHPPLLSAWLLNLHSLTCQPQAGPSICGQKYCLSLCFYWSSKLCLPPFFLAFFSFPLSLSLPLNYYFAPLIALAVYHLHQIVLENIKQMQRLTHSFLMIICVIFSCSVFSLPVLEALHVCLDGTGRRHSTTHTIQSRACV